jgi:hypothetical protein
VSSLLACGCLFRRILLAHFFSRYGKISATRITSPGNTVLPFRVKCLAYNGHQWTWSEAGYRSKPIYNELTISSSSSIRRRQLPPIKSCSTPVPLRLYALTVPAKMQNAMQWVIRLPKRIGKHTGKRKKRQVTNWCKTGIKSVPTNEHSGRSATGFSWIDAEWRGGWGWPDSNRRTRFRRSMLYPLSYSPNMSKNSQLAHSHYITW